MLCIDCGESIKDVAVRVKRCGSCRNAERARLNRENAKKAQARKAAADPFFIMDRNSRARSRRAGVEIGKVDYQALWDRGGGACERCEVPISLEAGIRKDRAAIDHIIPILSGGAHSQENCRFVCFSCNSSRRWKGG